LKSRHFHSEEKNSSLFVVQKDDFEFVNPWDQYKKDTINVSLQIQYLIIQENLPGIPMATAIKLMSKRANEDWVKKKEELKSIKIPDQLINLLESVKKRDQEKILKGLQLKSSELDAFILFAYDKFKYRYSMYTREFEQKGSEDLDLPTALLNDEGKVERYGKSQLSDGQIKQSIEHRKVHIARFLDLGNSFHCFFYTTKSLTGKENKLRAERPHLHYVSSAWSLPRKDLLEKLMTRRYNLGSTPHIDFLRYK
jgi:hypothetical protein